METMSKKQTAKSGKQDKVEGQKPKSRTTLFWEKYPDGILQIVDKRAILR